MAGGNAGLVKPKVYILDRSPFGSFRKQEQCFYITSETFYSVDEISHVTSLPTPINGCRIEERRVGYDNYIIDQKKNRLEKAIFEQKETVTDENGKEVSVSVVTEFDASGSARAKLKQFTDPESEEDGLKREFFTWQCETSIFGDVPRLFTENPQFDSAAEWTYINIPKPGLLTPEDLAKVSMAAATGGAVAGALATASALGKAILSGTSRILMPYQRKIPKDRSEPVHWGLKMIDRPYNQPFELTYYLCFRDASVADLAPEQRTTTGSSTNKFSFHYPDKEGKPGAPVELKLNKGLYLLVEIGEETPNHHYVILFAYGHKPMFFLVTNNEGGTNSGSTDVKNNQPPCLVRPNRSTSQAQTQNGQTSTQDGKFKAMLVNSYDNDTIVDTMFNTKQFTLSFESAGGMLMIRSSAFPEPWIIHPNMLNRTTGLFIGETLSAYGGNIQAGIAYAPIQYWDTGIVRFAGVTFEVTSSNYAPTCSVSNLGPSQILQDQTKSSSGETSQRLMVDTEELTIENNTFENTDTVQAFGHVNTLLGEDWWKKAKSVDRSIKITLKKNEATADPGEDGKKADALLKAAQTAAGCTELQKNVDISVFDAMGAPRGLLAFRTGSVTPVTWYPEVNLIASDVETANGFVIRKGRSPYLWLIRLYVEPPKESERPKRKYDLSCDVMSVDLTWNSTGPGEIACSGTIKVLANPRVSVPDDGVPDLMALTKRISYIDIEIDRKNSVIQDKVENDDRRIFTGCIVGADVQEEPGKTIISFKVEDYMWVLQAMKFNLSPYYDGMFYNYAIADMVAQTGFPMDRMFMDDTKLVPISGDDGPNIDNMPSLPCTNMFEQPQFRFKDGDALKDGISRIAKMDWRIFYFDSKGDFHYDSMPWGMYGNKKGETVFEFFTGDAPGWTPENLVWNSVSRGYAMRDMYNAVQVITVSKAIPSIYLLYQDINRDSIENPEKDGYIGFPKAMRQKEALFERAESAFAYFNALKNMLYLPPKTIRFETYGRVGFKAATVVSVDGQNWRLMNISLKMDASKNEFWASLEGEWFDQKVTNENGDKTANPGRPSSSSFVQGMA
jgi:hypothetical protein